MIIHTIYAGDDSENITSGAKEKFHTENKLVSCFKMGEKYASMMLDTIQIRSLIIFDITYFKLY